MRVFRVTRILSFLTAIVYNALYITSAGVWYDYIYIVTDKSNYNLPIILVNMLLGYNLILHSSVVVVNLVIIVKELSLNVFSVEGKKRKNEEDVFLNTDDLKEAENDINPMTYVDEIEDVINKK